MSTLADQGAFARSGPQSPPATALDAVVRFREVFVAAPIAVGIVISMALGSEPLTTVATFTAIGTALAAPSVGLAILAFMAPLVEATVIPPPGFAAAMTAAVLLGCVYRLPVERPTIRFGVPILAMIAIFVYVTVHQLPEMATGYVGDANRAVGYLYVQLLTGFGVVIAAIWLLRDESPIPILAMAIAGAVTAASIAVIPYLVPAIAGAFVKVSAESEDLIRASGTYGNPNFMGGAAAMAMTGTVGLLLGVRSRRVRLLLLGCAIVLGSAVLISLSRGALITGLVGLLAIGITRSRKTAIAVIVLGLVGTFVIYPAFVDWRLTSLTGSVTAAAFQTTADSDFGRLEGILAGLSLFLSSPVFGVGFGHYLTAEALIPGTQVAHAAHNWYTYMLGEQGALGTILWVLLLGTVATRILHRPAWPRLVGLSVLAALCAACLFLEVPTSFQTFAIPAIFLVASIVCRWPRAGSWSDVQIPREPVSP